jgi:hypothetical protein
MGPDGARYQERMCWRVPAAIYWTGLLLKLIPTLDQVDSANDAPTVTMTTD